jgi:hypothetical protein
MKERHLSEDLGVSFLALRFSQRNASLDKAVLDILSQWIRNCLRESAITKLVVKAFLPDDFRFPERIPLPWLLLKLVAQGNDNIYSLPHPHKELDKTFFLSYT